jgi:hypothetical protein
MQSLVDYSLLSIFCQAQLFNSGMTIAMTVAAGDDRPLRHGALAMQRKRKRPGSEDDRSGPNVEPRKTGRPQLFNAVKA